MKTEDKTERRKTDHIDLAFESRVKSGQTDKRFYYEPLHSAHPSGHTLPTDFLNKTLQLPIWVSSMTGGTEKAATINENLARACGEFGMGMGLGSCRVLLKDPTLKREFDVRRYIGDDYPLFGNLGIAQIEEFVLRKDSAPLNFLMEDLDLDGLIVHLNPLQEWLQPEGDHLERTPLDSIKGLLDLIDFPIIVKEVGQGMGYNSLRALFKLPLAAIDFGASGGTNFSILELLRSDEKRKKAYLPYAYVGHDAEEMVQMCNEINLELQDRRECNQIIISGGITHHLDGYWLMKKSNVPSIYGQASSFLRHAMGSYDEMREYILLEAEGLAMANAYLRVKTDS